MRMLTHEVNIGGVKIGGENPVAIQSMCNTKTQDVGATAAQIRALEREGCEIVRVAVPDMEAAKALSGIKKEIHIPLVADIHFDYRCALAAIDAGADALRLNPGNIGARENVQAVARAAKAKGVPIRVGVNGGSLEADILKKHGSATAEALVESALRHVALLEAEGFRDIAISVKASDVPRTLAAYRMLAERTDCPLHLGVTEAGTFIPGTVRSSVALGILLSEGIGDTIRVSLTDLPEKEVKVGLEILRSLGLREAGPSVTSCPTCGRTKVDVFGVAAAVEAALEKRQRAMPRGARLPKVAVMGCVVNGPGEAKGADVALCGGDGSFILFVRGVPSGKVSPENAVSAVMDAVAACRSDAAP
jgi:(E)-4-hydroxy-3-methylbut-2-enyl-diphosphate synthase